MRLRILLALTFGLSIAAVSGTPERARAQMGMGGPPAVGVIRARKQPITESDQFIGRIQATDRVSLVARVTAFLEQRFFTEGAEVKKGDLLYRLEQPPFQADVLAKQASVAQANAQLQNATITLNRAKALLSTPAGQRSTYDDALAAQRSDAAQLLAAQAQLQQSQINLGYTEIHAPIAGKIGRDVITVGNVVSPSSGPLNTIVSQDPMYVVFPVAQREELDLRRRYAKRGGFKAIVIKLRLPDGRIYGQEGKLNFVDNTVSPDTDTVILRGTIPNPVKPGTGDSELGDRELEDGEFVTVLLQGVQPVEVIAIPRAAVLSDQQGDYVYVVDAHNKVEQRRIQLGQSTPTTAVVLHGLQLGEMVVLEGLQRVRPGITVAPGPASEPVSLSDSAGNAIEPGGAAPAAGAPATGAAPSGHAGAGTHG
ncbi:MAG TPA: efflux RND transporter periplasmic adaptor subunit [Acetobacteraceae bacterium]|nr:efflux RND transporter periplasmic adaptor subunit [Acetobacteraceae bacterium]